MAIGKGSMARAAKAVKEVAKEEVKEEVKTVVKKPAASKKPATTVVTPTKQVMDMVEKDRIEVGDDMPIYFY